MRSTTEVDDPEAARPAENEDEALFSVSVPLRIVVVVFPAWSVLKSRLPASINVEALRSSVWKWPAVSLKLSPPMVRPALRMLVVTPGRATETVSEKLAVSVVPGPPTTLQLLFAQLCPVAPVQLTMPAWAVEAAKAAEQRRDRLHGGGNGGSQESARTKTGSMHPSRLPQVLIRRICLEDRTGGPAHSPRLGRSVNATRTSALLQLPLCKIRASGTRSNSAIACTTVPAPMPSATGGQHGMTISIERPTPLDSYGAVSGWFVSFLRTIAFPRI